MLRFSSKTLHRIAKRLRPVTAWLIAGLIVTAVMTAYVFLSGTSAISSDAQLGCIALLLWWLSLLVAIALFAEPLPEVPEDVSRIKRWLIRGKRLFFHLAAWLLMGTNVATIYLTTKAIGFMMA